MKITENKLKEIIREEIKKILQERKRKKGSAYAVCMDKFAKKHGKPGSKKKNWSSKTKGKYERCVKKVAKNPDYSK